MGLSQAQKRCLDLMHELGPAVLDLTKSSNRSNPPETTWRLPDGSPVTRNINDLLRKKAIVIKGKGVGAKAYPLI